jgi:hypothetical protein
VGSRLREGNPDSEHSCVILDFKKYVTYCGLEWKDMPSSQDGCEHLDCAIYLALKDAKSAPLNIICFIIFLLISKICITIFDSIFRIYFTGSFAIFAFVSLTCGLGSWRDSIELAEYKERGTIDGITALQIFEDQEVAKAKHWWQFWK